MTDAAKPVLSQRLLWSAVAGAAVVMAASAGLFYYASINRKPAETAGAVRVEVGASSCTPADLTLPAGRHLFEIHNTSDRPVEWEILNGVLVIEERENILPGYTQTLAANLKPGAYEITCGLITNPHGTLTVTGTAQSAAAAAAGPDIKAFIGPLSEYRVFLAMQSSRLVSATEALAAAVKAGDVAAAAALYAPARAPYRRIEAIMGRVADLQTSIDPEAAYLAGREQDAAFIGFHRLEYGLFAEKSTDGLGPVADRLVADVTALKTRLRELKLDPADFAGAPARLARRLAEGKVEAGENAYSGTDLADFAASLEGITRLAGLMKPVLPDASADLRDALDRETAATAALIEAHRSGDGYADFRTVPAADRKAIADGFAALAGTLDRVAEKLALE